MDNIIFFILLFVIIIGVFVGWIFAGQPKTVPETPCEKYRNYVVANIPVRCLEYYGIGK